MALTVLTDENSRSQQTPSRGGTRGFGCKTILYNDNTHTFEQVAAQLVKAIHCDHSRGMVMANTVHTTGSAIVYVGHFERCEAVAMVLEEIGLSVALES